MDIIALIYLSLKVKKIVIAKGLRPTHYIVTLVLLCLSLELLGFAGGAYLFKNQIAMLLMPLLGAAIGLYLGYKLAINAEPANQNLDE